MSVKKYLTLSGLTYFLNKIKTYLTSSTYLNSIGISNSDIDDIADDAGYSSGSLPASEDIFITGDIIPNTDNSVDLGASSKNIKMIYTKGITINGTQFLPSDYVDLNSNQTVGGNKEFTGTTNVKSLTINGVACGDILTHNVSEFVGVSGNQTIGGVKTFSQEVTMFGRDINLMSRIHYGKNSNPSATSWHYLFFRGNTATEGYTNSWYSGYLEQVVNTNGSTRGRWFIRDTSENSVCIELFVNGSDKYVRPHENNTTDLGTSTNKWKSFNGINPGALSLPSMSFISLDTTGFDVTATTIGTFASTVDGWAILSISQKNKPFGIWILQGSYRVTFQSVHHQDDYFIFALIPVMANVSMTIYCTANDIDSTRKVDWLKLFPCKGNV